MAGKHLSSIRRSDNGIPYDRAGFMRCLPNACVAKVVMDDKLLADGEDRDIHYF